MILNSNITLVSIQGVPILTLDLFMTLYFIAHIFFHKGKYQSAKRRSPLKTAFMMLFLFWE